MSYFLNLKKKKCLGTLEMLTWLVKRKGSSWNSSCRFIKVLWISLSAPDSSKKKIFYSFEARKEKPLGNDMKNKSFLLTRLRFETLCSCPWSLLCLRTHICLSVMIYSKAGKWDQMFLRMKLLFVAAALQDKLFSWWCDQTATSI